MTIRDYFCFLWYNFKKRRRFNKRRKRRMKNMKNARFSPGGRFQQQYRKESNSNDRSENARKNSLIFKRRSVIYRNKHRKPAAIAVMTSNPPSTMSTGGGGGVGGGGGLSGNSSRMHGGSFSSNVSTKRSVKFRSNVASSFSQAGATATNVSMSDDELNTTIYAPSVSSVNEMSNADMARMKKNLSIYFENQVEDIV